MKTMKTVSVEAATLDELKWFLKQQLNIEPKSTDVAKLRATVEMSYDKDTFEVPVTITGGPQMPAGKTSAPLRQGVAGTTKEAPVTKGSALVDKTSDGDPRVKIYIPAQPGPGGNRNVPVSVNGRTILLPRNKEIVIAYRFYDAMRIAVERQCTHSVDPAGGAHPIEEWRDVQSYPFSVIEMAPKEEVAAWLAAQDAAGLKEATAETKRRREKAAA